MNSWVRHYMIQDKEELVGMLLSRDKAIKLFEKKLHTKDKEIERLKRNNNKAINYLKSYIEHYDKGDKECMLYSTNELLNILKGSDKE